MKKILGVLFISVSVIFWRTAGGKCCSHLACELRHIQHQWDCEQHQRPLTDAADFSRGKPTDTGDDALYWRDQADCWRTIPPISTSIGRTDAIDADYIFECRMIFGSKRCSGIRS